MRTTRYRIIISLSLAVLLSLAGCGKSPAPDSGPKGSDEAAGQADAPVSREITLTANDQMKYNVESFSVQAGETVRLTLKNIGKMPKFSMGHNVVILTQGTDSLAFVEAAANSAVTDYVPTGSEKKVIAHTRLLGGGEEDSIVFTAPRKTGDYPFVCSFPGHYQVGMKGTMKVQ
jgi:azurin